MSEAFKRISSFVKEHYGIIICSFLLTILIFAPLLVFPYVIKNDYRGININWFGSDAHFYLTRGKEVLDGNGLGNPILREGKNQADASLSYGDYILLAPVKLLGLEQKVNIVTLYNVYNFIGVFILILLIYFFVLRLSGDKLLSAAAAVFAIGGYSIIYRKTLFYGDFNVYARLIYPYFSSLIMFAYLNLLVKSLKSIELKYKILASAVFGLLFYIYFYAWSFVLALNGCLFLIYFFRKDFASLKKVLLISLIGLALGAYYLILLFGALTTEAGKQASYFLWMSYGHGSLFSLIGFFTLALFAWFFYKCRDDKNLPLVFAVILSGWLALNQQIITGRMLQYGHYYWYFVVPLSIIISFYMVGRLLKNENLRKYLFIFLIAVAFINTAGGQYKSFYSTLPQKKYEQNFRPLIDALNQDKTPGVILADQVNEYLFTIYTPHDLFWHTAATFNNLPIQRFKDALFVYLYLNKDSRNDFKAYLEKIADYKAKPTFYQSLYRNLEGYWSGYSYYEYTNRAKSGDPGLSLKRPEIIKQLTEGYEAAVLKNNGINNLLKRYGVNYIVWDKNKNPEWDLGEIKGFKPVVSYNNIYLYKLE